MKKKILIGIIFLIVIVGLAVVIYKKSTPTIKEVNLKEKAIIATIIQSKYEGPDMGTEYIIEIYEGEHNQYPYKIKTNTITIAGPTEVKSQTGIIQNKSQLKKIIKKKSGFEEYIYYESNTSISRNELINQLFK